MTLANLTGVAALAATVTTNANLTGPVTSVGNATAIVGPVPQSAVNLSTVTTVLDAVGASTAALAASTTTLGAADLLRVAKAGDTMTGSLYVGTNSVVANNVKANVIVMASTGGATATIYPLTGSAGYINLSGGLGTGGSNGTADAQRLTASGNLVVDKILASETRISNVDFLTSGTIDLINGGNNWYWAEIVDINQDGKPDMVYSSDVRVVRVQIGAGGGFVGASGYNSTNYGTASGNGGLDTGDVNGDGLPDIVEVNPVDSVAIVWINRGISTATTFASAFSGPFTYAVSMNSDTGSSMRLGDLNGDGKPDILVNRGSSDLLKVLMNNGDGTFASEVTYATGDNPQELAIADLNRDGRNDVVVANYDDNNISVFLNQGNGVLGAKTDYALGSVLGTDYGGNPSGLAFGDFNQDGKLDILVANHNTIASTDSTMTRLLGDGSGGFASPINYYACQFASDVKVGDFNGDGIDDALSICDFSQHTITYYVGTGTGTWSTITLRDGTGGDRMEKMAVGDINLDGHLDLVYGADGSGPRQLIGLVTPMIFAQASTGRVGISTGAPQATFDVVGNAAFGSTTKSTFSVTGALSIATTLNVASTATVTYFAIPTPNTPASSIVVESTGTFSWDGSYFYIQVSSASKKRIALTSF